MKIQYEFNKEGTLDKIIFVGLSGLENVSMLKEAVKLLSIENPTKTFAEKMKAGEFYFVPEKNVVKEARIANFLAELWKCEKSDKDILPSLSPLSLLAASLVLNVELAKKLRIL